MSNVLNSKLNRLQAQHDMNKLQVSLSQEADSDSTTFHTSILENEWNNLAHRLTFFYQISTSNRLASSDKIKWTCK